MKLSKIIRKGILTLVIGILLFLIAFYFPKRMLKENWRIRFDSDDLKKVAVQIDKTSELPDNFNQIINSYYPLARQCEMDDKYRDMFWQEIMWTRHMPRRHYGHNHYFAERILNLVIDTFGYIGEGLFNENIVFAYGMEKFTNPSKCVDYFYKNRTLVTSDTNGNKVILKGIDEISRYLFGREVEDLNEAEVIKLFVHVDDRYNYYPIECDSINISRRIGLVQRIMKK